MSTQRHPGGADGAKPDHGALACHRYGLLALKEPAGNPYTAGPQGSKDSPNDTMGRGDTDGRETGAGIRNGQRAILESSQTEDKEEEQKTPEQQRRINVCIHQEGGGGVPQLSSTRFPRAARGWRRTP